MTDFGDIRSLLQQTPDRATWRQLCTQVHTLARTTPDTFEQAILPYIQNHLERWPAQLCQAPDDWLKRLFERDEDHMGWGIVRAITCRDQDIEEEHIESIAYCKWLTNLRILDLSRSRRTVWRRHNLYTAGVSCLAQSPHLSNLEVFRAAGHHIRPEGLRMMGSSRTFASLKMLDLAHNNFGFLRAVGNEVWDMPNLEYLSLSDTELSWPGLDYMLQTGVLSRLHRLDISNNELGGQGIEQLFDTQAYPNLTSLNVAGCKLQLVGLDTMTHIRSLESLTTLDISNNELGDDGAIMLSRSPLFANLQTLIIKSNALNSGGFSALLTSPTFQKLEVIDVSFNMLCHEAMHSLAQWRPLEGCETLDLSHNNVGDEGVIALLNSPYIHQLKTLNLSRNHIGDEGARLLAQASKLPNLEVLNLSDNQISERGFRPYATRSQHGALSVLNAHGNAVDVEQMQEIVEHKVPFEWQVSLEPSWHFEHNDEDYDDDFE